MSQQEIIKVNQLSKAYPGGFKALNNVSLSVRKGEIFALLGPNGAGKTTLINAICGLVQPTAGQILVDGFDNVKDYRKAREKIGLVPQELTTEAFESVFNTVSFSRGLFGKVKNTDYILQLLKQLSLYDKRNSRMMQLSGGMKRRVLIAKALAHEPQILFLDEPTAGVDVDLRRDMWALVSELREQGVTIILTTHYLEEAEQMADRIGVINKGNLLLVEEKKTLIAKLGRKTLTIVLQNPLEMIPDELNDFSLELASQGHALTYHYQQDGQQQGIASLLDALAKKQIAFTDLQTTQSSLEDIFIDLIRKQA